MTDTQQPTLRQLRGKYAQRGSTVDTAYWTIRDAIRSGVIAPGERLIELDLAAALEMSRTPIREALHRLEVERLVENAPRRGLIVPVITIDDLVEIFEIREVLEGLAARRAAQRMSDAERQALEATVVQMEQAQATDDLTSLSAASAQFHRLLRSGSKHARLPALIALLNDSQRPLLAHEMAPERAGAAIAEHRAIMEAIVSNDAPLAERLAREHARHALHAQIIARHLSSD